MSYFFKGVFIMFSKKESGQALILITLAAVGLFAFAALAIDGSRVYSDKRHAQNAADTAALAGALAYARAEEDDIEDEDDILDVIEDAAQPRASDNGYDGGAKNDVTISFVDNDDGCPSGEGINITVHIDSDLDMTLARVIGRSQFRNQATSITHSCRPDEGIPFDGNAVVGLREFKPGDKDDKDCGITSGTSNWTVTGGGVWSNGCAAAKKDFILDGDGDPDDPNTKCVSGTHFEDPDDFPCTTPVDESDIFDMTYVERVMPDPDPCEGALGADGRYATGGKKATSGQTDFNGGVTGDVFCLEQIDYFDGEMITVTNATLYVTDQEFEIKYTGSEGSTGIYGTAPTSGTYAGYFMVVEPNTGKPCTDFNGKHMQTMELRGNGSQFIAGMILAPTSCIDFRGSSDGKFVGQVIGYMVSGNGAATFEVNYDPDAMPMISEDGSISMWE